MRRLTFYYLKNVTNIWKHTLTNSEHLNSNKTLLTPNTNHLLTNLETDTPFTVSIYSRGKGELRSVEYLNAEFRTKAIPLGKPTGLKQTGQTSHSITIEWKMMNNPSVMVTQLFI